MGRYPTGFVLALALHLAILLLMVAWSLFRERPPEEPFTFELVSPPIEFRPETPPPPRDVVAPPEPAPTPPVREINFQMPDLPEVPVVIPRSNERPRPTPPPEPRPAPPPPPPPPARTTIDDFRRDTPPPRPTPPRPAPTRPPVEAPRVTAPQPAWQNIERNVDPAPTPTNRPPTQAERDELQRYFDRLHAAIYAVWIASAADFEPGLVTRVRFTLSAEGVLRNPSVVTSSGNARFDQSILAALRQVRPIGPVPTREEMTITLPFRMVE